MHNITYIFNLKIQHDPWRTQDNFESQDHFWLFKKELKTFGIIWKKIILPYKLNNTNFPPIK